MDDFARWHHIEPVLGDRPLDNITPRMVQELLDGLQPQLERLRGRKLSPATKHRVFSLLRRLFNWSIKMGYFDGLNPCRRVEVEKYDNSRHRYLSQEELQRLLNELERDCNRTASLCIRFLLLTGRRRGEVMKLQRTDVDIDRGLITLRHTKNGRTQSVPVNSQALLILQKVYELHNGEHGEVFPFHSKWTLERVWKRIRRRAGLVDFRLHDLRHSFASLAASSGQVDLYTLQNLLGHRSITMTQRYAHLFPGALRNAVEVVGAMISN